MRYNLVGAVQYSLVPNTLWWRVKFSSDSCEIAPKTGAGDIVVRQTRVLWDSLTAPTATLALGVMTLLVLQQSCDITLQPWDVAQQLWDLTQQLWDSHKTPWDVTEALRLSHSLVEPRSNSSITPRLNMHFDYCTAVRQTENLRRKGRALGPMCKDTTENTVIHIPGYIVRFSTVLIL